MIDIDDIKLFVLANTLIEDSLDKAETAHGLNLGRGNAIDSSEPNYYAQFDLKYRDEAKEMSKHYEVFYCIERSIRSLVNELMVEKYQKNWWDSKVKDGIKENVRLAIKNEEDSSFTIRSDSYLDYTTFGELKEIVTDNWDAFADTFRNKRAFFRIMTSLNQLRGPIAHCCPLAPDEVDRLNLLVKDWFRLMEQ